ncbi:MAG TPA: hypothetical protein VHE81_16205 [Lacipirellulaceae bacterium]|nr:hypothetical protein [Lacipirellulaceae bacterium]
MGLDASVFRDDEEAHRIASVRLGNIAQIAYLSDTISRSVPTATVLLEKVLYSGSHAGDELRPEEVLRVGEELAEVSRTIRGDTEVQAFVSRFQDVVEVALQNVRPITF